MTAIGCGIRTGTIVKYLGTGSFDIAIVPSERSLPDISGLTGKVPNGIVPGFTGLQTASPAVGSVLEWYCGSILGNDPPLKKLTKEACVLKAGRSGILALDWHSGCISPLFDRNLCGLLVGQTLETAPIDVLRALIEAPAMAVRSFIQRLGQYGIEIGDIAVTGPLAAGHPQILQVYADITGLTIRPDPSKHPGARGAALCAAVAAKKFDSVRSAIDALAGKAKAIRPEPANRAVYDRLFRLYRQLFDAFGTPSWKGNCRNVMEELIQIRSGAGQ
jgi:L-ribulokinase